MVTSNDNPAGSDTYREVLPLFSAYSVRSEVSDSYSILGIQCLAQEPLHRTQPDLHRGLDLALQNSSNISLHHPGMYHELHGSSVSCKLS